MTKNDDILKKSEEEKVIFNVCLLFPYKNRTLDANVILHSSSGQTITTAAKLAAAFTSLSPDVWVSGVSNLFFPGAIGDLTH